MTDFNRSEEAKNIFKEKRKPKNPISFKIQLNEEQKEAKQVILDHPVTLLKGMAGSGKTLVACQVALDLIAIDVNDDCYAVFPIHDLDGNL